MDRILAIMVVASISGSTGLPAQPISLVAEEADQQVRLQIVGSSQKACEARYELEVTGAGGNNRSVQSGRARILPGTRVVLATTNLGNAAGASWSATLRVQSCDGSHYELAQSGPA